MTNVTVAIRNFAKVSKCREAKSSELKIQK